jgi:hypothetical protein
MAAPFITINREDKLATHAGRVLAVNSQVKVLMESLETLIAESFQMFDGNGAEQFTMPKVKYGVTTNAQAQTVFDLMNGTLNALKGTAQNANAIDLATRIG